MGASTTRSLFIQIGGSSSDLAIAAKAGKSALLDLATGGAASANELQAAVRNSFEKLGGTIADQVKALEQSSARSFANIRATAEAALKAPSGSQGLFLDVGAAREDAAKLQSVAEYYRQLADGQARLVESGQEVSAQARAEAVSLELLAISYANSSAAARESVSSLERLAAESGIATEDLAKLAEREAEAAATALELAQAQEQLASRSDRLLSAIDPLFAAQQRYNGTVAEASSLLAAGAISAERYAQAETFAAAALREVADAAGVAAERQRDLYATQAAAARVEVRGNQAQDAIAAAEQINLANKSAADSFAFFEKVGVAEAQSIDVFERTTVRSVIEGSQQIALANKSAAASFDVFRAAGIAEAQVADAVAGGHNRIGASGLIADHVVRSFTDSVVAGQSPARALALELPRIGEAFQLLSLTSGETEGAFGRFASFMGGPFGIALTIGLSTVAAFGGALLETSNKVDDAVQKLKQHAEEAAADAKAQTIFGQSAEGVTKAIEDQNKALEKSIQSQKDDETATLKTAEGHRQAAIQIRQELAARLALAEQNLEAQQTRSVGPGQRGDLAAIGLPGAEGQIAGVKAQIAANEAAIAAAQQGVREAQIPIAVRAAKDAVEPIARINDLYDDMASKAKHAAAGNDALAASLAATLTKIEQQRKAAIDAEKETEKENSASANRQVGRQINLQQAEDIVHGIGGTVTSAQRSTAQQQVLYNRYLAGTGSLAAKPGTSLHETGQALDVAKTAGVSLASLKKAFEDAGVHLTEALDEGSHFHVGFGPKGRQGPSAETLARRQLASQDKAINQDGSYQNELRAAQDALAQEQDRLPQTPDQRYAADVGKADDDFIQRDSGFEDQVASGKLTAANALVLEQVYYHLAELQKQGAALRRDTDLGDEKFALDATALDVQQDLAKLDEQLAPTREARLKLEQQILAGQQQAYREQLDRDIANARTNPEAAEKAVIAYQTIGQREAAQNANLAKTSEGPGQQFLTGLHATSLNDQIDQVKVDAIKGLGSELEDAATKALKLHGVLGTIASDLIKIAIEREIEEPIANTLFGAGSASGKASGGGIFSTILGLFGGGKASGGPISGSKFYLVGENGPELFAPGMSGSIIPNMPSIPSAASIARPAASAVTIGVVANDYFDAKVTSISGGVVQQTAPHVAAAGAQMAGTNAARARRRALA